MKLKLLITFLLLILLQTVGFGQTYNNPANNGAAANQFTAPAGSSTLTVECWGGGGAGGGANETNTKVRTGGGGGGGGYTKNIVSVTSGQIVAVTVGAGGTGVTSNDGTGLGNGNPGTASTFLTVTAAGGSGGTQGYSADQYGNGGAGGVGGTYSGGAGQNGSGNSGGGGSSAGTGSNGQTGILAGRAAEIGGGAGAAGRNGDGNGTSATTLGGGGGGARMDGSNGSADYRGGNGFRGQVVVAVCATISTITAPAAMCSGTSFSPATPTITSGSAISSQGWEMSTTSGGSTYANLTVPYTVALADNGKNIRYKVTNACATTYSNVVALTVNSSAIVPASQVGATQTFCIDNGVTFTSANASAGQYVLVNVIKGFKYTFSVGNAFASFDENLTILEASTNANVAPATSATGASGVTITDWPCSLSGQIKVVLSAACGANGTAGNSGITITQTAIGNTQETQNEFGTNNWVGHIYNSSGAQPGGSPSPSILSTTTTPFISANYAGNYTIATEAFTENFGSATACIPVFSNGVQRASMYAETYAVRYKMKSTSRNGCFLVGITGDDGVRLYLNGSIIIDKWLEQAATTYNNVLVSLDGDDDLVLDYYENATNNQVNFTITAFDASTNTVTPSSSNYCGGPAVILNGTDYLVNGQANPYLTFQWESSSNNSTWTNTGITTEDYSVSPTTTTYYRRVVKAIIGSCSVTSNSVVVNSAPVIITQPSTPAATCSGSGTQSMTVAAAGTGLTYDWQLGGVSVANGGVISGQGTATLTLTNPTEVNAGSYTVVVSGTCSPSVTSTARTVTVTPLPNNVTNGFSATTICAGGTPQLTFDAEDSTFSGTYSITYRNDTTLVEYTQSITADSAFSFTPGGSPTVNTGYTLVSISNGTCVRTASFGDPGANLIVRPIPTASISGTTSVCIGDTPPNIVFTNPQTVAITVTYTINSGANQTINVAASSTSSIPIASTASSDSFAYDLVSVVYQDTPGCTNNAVTGSATVTVIENSGGISLNSGTAIASGGNTTYCPSNTAVFSIASVSGTTGYTWVVPAGWTIVSGQGTTSLTVTTGTSAESGNVIVTANTFCPSYLGVTLSTIPPTAPTVTETQPTCAVPTGTIKVDTPVPASGIVYTLTGTNPVVAAVTNTSGVFPNLAAGDYVVTSQQGSGCVSVSTATISIQPLVTKTWNGTAWSPSGPTSLNDYVVFNGVYAGSLDSVNACSCTVNTGAIVTIGSGKVLIIENGLTVQAGGSLTFANGASLIQNNENAINTGNIIYKRTATGVKDFDYVYWSSPVAGQTLGALSPLSDKYWSWTSGGWFQETGSAAMTQGKGYIARVPRYVTSQTVNFIGTPHNGDVFIATQGGPLENNLIGNPYPSAIDASLFLTDNIDLISDGGMLSFWTHITPRLIIGGGTQLGYVSNDYSYFTLSGGTAAESGGLPPDGTIGAGQSFMVRSEIADFFKFTNSMRISDENSNSKFFRQSNTKKTAKIEKNRVWLNLTNDKGAFKQLLVGYITGATNDADKLYDGVSLNENASVDFYSVMNSKKYTIQGRKLPFNETDEVPLGYNTTIEGTFQISIDKTDGFLTNQTVYLEDKTVNVIHDLTKGSYSFTTAKGDFKDRFVLRYTNTSKLGTGDFDPKGKGVIVSVNNSQIKINSFDKTVSSVKVYDLKGSLLYEKSKVDKNEFVIDHFASSTQFMIVMVQLEDGSWVSEEIIFHD